MRSTSRAPVEKSHSVAGEYGDIAALPGAFAQFLQGVFTGANAPDPHDVSKALVELIATPGGKRPARVVVGASFGADAVNSAVEPIQAQLISGIGFDNLSKLNVEQSSQALLNHRVRYDDKANGRNLYAYRS